jgi:hypothetical protein
MEARGSGRPREVVVNFAQIAAWPLSSNGPSASSNAPLSSQRQMHNTRASYYSLSRRRYDVN